MRFFFGALISILVFILSWFVMPYLIKLTGSSAKDLIWVVIIIALSNAHFSYKFVTKSMKRTKKNSNLLDDFEV